jgi:hypothetical protein
MQGAAFDAYCELSGDDHDAFGECVGRGATKSGGISPREVGGTAHSVGRRRRDTGAPATAHGVVSPHRREAAGARQGMTCASRSSPLVHARSDGLRPCGQCWHPGSPAGQPRTPSAHTAPAPQCWCA